MFLNHLTNNNKILYQNEEDCYLYDENDKIFYIFYINEINCLKLITQKNIVSNIKKEYPKYKEMNFPQYELLNITIYHKDEIIEGELCILEYENIRKKMKMKFNEMPIEFQSGSNIINFAIKFCKKIGIDRIRLRDVSSIHVNGYKFNLSLIRSMAIGKTFYQKFGFQPDNLSYYKKYINMINNIGDMTINYLFTQLNNNIYIYKQMESYYNITRFKLGEITKKYSGIKIKKCAKMLYNRDNDIKIEFLYIIFLIVYFIYIDRFNNMYYNINLTNKYYILNIKYNIRKFFKRCISISKM